MCVCLIVIEALWENRVPRVTLGVRGVCVYVHLATVAAATVSIDRERRPATYRPCSSITDWSSGMRRRGRPVPVRPAISARHRRRSRGRAFGWVSNTRAVLQPRVCARAPG
jgi:hypothetical protein